MFKGSQLLSERLVFTEPLTFAFGLTPAMQRSQRNVAISSHVAILSKFNARDDFSVPVDRFVLRTALRILAHGPDRQSPDTDCLGR